MGESHCLRMFISRMSLNVWLFFLIIRKYVKAGMERDKTHRSDPQRTCPCGNEVQFASGNMLHYIIDAKEVASSSGDDIEADDTRGGSNRATVHDVTARRGILIVLAVLGLSRGARAKKCVFHCDVLWGTWGSARKVF